MTAPFIPPEIPITLVGHPFATVGMGEQLRSHIAACQTVHLPHSVMDIFRHAARADPEHVRLVATSEVEAPAAGIRVFHINGDEVDRAIEAFERRGGTFSDGYNIVVPAWELPRYPQAWAAKLRSFDEVWALSRFIADGLKAANLASTLVGQAIEVQRRYFLPRKYFGIRESAFALLHFFDLSSYACRKNPDAAVKMFQDIRRRRVFEDIQLVLKVKHGDRDGEEWLRPIREEIPEAVCLPSPMSTLETHSLINACDCFVSLHRSEGFGRGTGEAMFLGRIALATGWSGNLDFMNAENALLVNHRLVPVADGEYPFGKGQVWAEADVDHAATLLEAVLDDRERAAAIGARARRDIRLGYGFRAVGLRILGRLAEISDALQARPKLVARKGRATGTNPTGKTERTALSSLTHHSRMHIKAPRDR
jgi:glycosyltransferase involved in cell wall biosynthesis